MAKKDQSFYVNKAQVLRNLGIEAQTISEQTAVDVSYNEAHFNSIAESKGLSPEDFMKDIEAQAEAGSVEPPKPQSTRDVLDGVKGASAEKAKSASKSTKSKSSTAKKTSAPKAKTTAETKKEDVKPVVPEDKKSEDSGSKVEEV